MKTEKQIHDRITALKIRRERLMGQKRSEDAADCLSDIEILTWVLQ